MLNKYQIALLNGFGNSRLHGCSYAIIKDIEEEKYNNDYFLVVSCEALWNDYRNSRYCVITWMHPKIYPCWNDYDINEDEFSEYIHKHFSIIITVDFMKELRGGI